MAKKSQSHTKISQQVDPRRERKATLPLPNPTFCQGHLTCTPLGTRQRQDVFVHLRRVKCETGTFSSRIKTTSSSGGERVGKLCVLQPCQKFYNFSANCMNLARFT